MELEAIFPDCKLPETPPGLDSPIYAAGSKLERVEYRVAARKVVGALHLPRIRAMEIKAARRSFSAPKI